MTVSARNEHQVYKFQTTNFAWKKNRFYYSNSNSKIFLFRISSLFEILDKNMEEVDNTKTNFPLKEQEHSFMHSLIHLFFRSFRCWYHVRFLVPSKRFPHRVGSTVSPFIFQYPLVSFILKLQMNSSMSSLLPDFLQYFLQYCVLEGCPSTRREQSS